MKKKRTIAEFSAAIGELAKLKNENYYNVTVQLKTTGISTSMQYSAYIHGFDHVNSSSIDDCIECLKIAIGIVSPIDNIVCEL